MKISGLFIASFNRMGIMLKCLDSNRRKKLCSSNKKEREQRIFSDVY